jgi:Mn-dependent DtxR family transcriptional regulator
VDPSALRHDILRQIDQHEATGSSAYLDDKTIASTLEVEVAAVQRQLDILEHRGLVSLAKAFGPSYGARLTPAGMEEVEAVGS